MCMDNQNLSTIRTCWGIWSGAGDINQANGPFTLKVLYCTNNHIMENNFIHGHLLPDIHLEAPSKNHRQSEYQEIPQIRWQIIRYKNRLHTHKSFLPFVCQKQPRHGSNSCIFLSRFCYQLGKCDQGFILKFAPVKTFKSVMLNLVRFKLMIPHAFGQNFNMRQICFCYFLWLWIL